MALIRLSEETTKTGWIMKIIQDFFGEMEYVDYNEFNKTYTYRVLGAGVPKEDIEIIASITQDERQANYSIEWKLV